MNEQDIDMLRADAEAIAAVDLWGAGTYGEFAARVIELCKDYTELRAERDGLKDQVYDLLSLRHGSSMVRCSAVVPQESE